MPKRYYNEHLTRMCKGIKSYGKDESYPQKVDPCKLGVSNCNGWTYGCTAQQCNAPKQVKPQDKK